MAVIGLTIVEPMNDSAYIGDGGATLRGRVSDRPVEIAAVRFYYRWYDSLFPADKNRYSVHPVALNDPESPLAVTLALGSHAITLGGSDRAGETDADLEAVAHGGMAGGSQGDAACRVHVFIAALRQPLPPGPAALQRAGSLLAARAPSLWGKYNDQSGLFEVNGDYHGLNRLQYRWRFTPSGPPAGRAAVDFIPAVEAYLFAPATDLDPDSITYSGPLPGALDGNYTLTLHVEDAQGQLGGHATAGVAVNVGA
ncbi:MAG: hypothetical protein WAU91_14595 [Desulfatitalea sp.]